MDTFIPGNDSVTAFSVDAWIRSDMPVSSAWVL